MNILKAIVVWYPIMPVEWYNVPSSLHIKVYIWSYDQKYHKFSYYFLYISAASIANIYLKLTKMDITRFAIKLFIYCQDRKYNSLGATKMQYFICPGWYVSFTCRWSKWNLVLSKFWWCSMTTTRFGNKTRSLHTKQFSECKLESFTHFALWLSIVNYCILWLCTVFLSGSVLE